jgi:hypothetical protein
MDFTRLSAGAGGEGSGPVNPEQNGPARVAAAPAQKSVDLFSLPPAAQPTNPPDGETLRDEAMLTLYVHHGHKVLHAQRMFVGLLLERGQATVDDLHAALGQLADGNPRRLGAAMHGLRRAGLIRRLAFVETGRRVAHARPVSVWQLANADAARAWLAGQ